MKRSASPVDKVAKEDERRRNDTYIGDAICPTEGLGDPTEHDQACLDRNQIYRHPNDEFYDGRGLTAAVAFLPRKILARASEAPAVPSRSLCRPVTRAGN